MDNEDLRYKFDFSKASMEELLVVMSWSTISVSNPAFVGLANIALLKFADKVSVTDISKIPADMLVIFLKEFAEAFDEWAKEVGLVK